MMGMLKLGRAGCWKAKWKTRLHHTYALQISRARCCSLATTWTAAWHGRWTCRTASGASAMNGCVSGRMGVTRRTRSSPQIPPMSTPADGHVQVSAVHDCHFPDPVVHPIHSDPESAAPVVAEKTVHLARLVPPIQERTPRRQCLNSPTAESEKPGELRRRQVLDPGHTPVSEGSELESIHD